MDDEAANVACKLQVFEAEQLKLVRRWIDELEGHNRYKAFELLELVMSGEITNEEAFTILGSKDD